LQLLQVILFHRHFNHYSTIIQLSKPWQCDAIQNDSNIMEHHMAWSNWRFLESFRGWACGSKAAATGMLLASNLGTLAEQLRQLISSAPHWGEFPNECAIRGRGFRLSTEYPNFVCFSFQDGYSYVPNSENSRTDSFLVGNK
jgi:hypothetical protein